MASIYAHGGLSLSDAVDISLIESVEARGLPFNLRAEKSTCGAISAKSHHAELNVDGVAVLPSGWDDGDERPYAPVWEVWPARFDYSEAKGCKYRPVVVADVCGDGSLVMMVPPATNKLHLKHLSHPRLERSRVPEGVHRTRGQGCQDSSGAPRHCRLHRNSDRNDSAAVTLILSETASG